MKKMELVFIPGFGIGHLSSTIQIASLLLHRHETLSITIFLIPLPNEPDHDQPQPQLHSLISHRIRFITLPHPPQLQLHAGFLYKAIMEAQKPHLKQAVADLFQPSNSPKLAGFVLDMFCTTIIDVANELGVPAYIFFTSNAAYLSFTLRLQQFYDRESPHNDQSQQFLHSESDFTEVATVPGFTNPIPRNAIPGVFFHKEIAEWLHDNTRRFKETSGILINTFFELESNVLNSFPPTSQFPTVYAVGPILDLNKNSTTAESAEILKWLDEQPPSSVLFLCFGSRGSIHQEQAKEIANALERSGYRFLWSLRKPSSKGIIEMPTQYENFEEILPEGFLDRTADIGRVIGWAPQVEILAHPATGGFVSHCGWNSTLESLWYGVPIGAWPMYSEQHFNAHEMVVELGIAVEISMETKLELSKENKAVVSAEKIEEGIRKLMDGNSNEEMRKLVKEKSEESGKSISVDGSSFNSLNRFIDTVISNCPQ